MYGDGHILIGIERRCGATEVFALPTGMTVLQGALARLAGVAVMRQRWVDVKL